MKWMREWRIEDAADIAEALNNKKVQDNLRDGIPLPYTKADGEAYIQSMLSGPKDSQYAWAIQMDGRAVGSLAIFRKENIHSRTGELGYYIAEEYWGKGIVAQAVQEACDYVFDYTDLLRVFAEPFSYNTGSRRVLEKAGFTFEGTLRQNAVKNGEILDMSLYALLREDWLHGRKESGA